MTKINKYIQASIEVKRKILEDKNILGAIDLVVNKITELYGDENKLLIAGNGGSAADAQHFAAEIVGRFKKERKGYPAIALTTDSSFLTAWANDYDFDTVFSRQVEALGASGDMFFGISTSGNSGNIIKAVNAAKKAGLSTVCLLGKDGGRLKGVADYEIIVPSADTARIQEAHIMLIHIICEEIEKILK